MLGALAEDGLLGHLGGVGSTEVKLSSSKERSKRLLDASFFSAALRFFFRAAALLFLFRVLRGDRAFGFDGGTFRRRRLPVEVRLSASIFGCISNNEDVTYVLPGNRNSLVYFTLKNKNSFPT